MDLGFLAETLLFYGRVRLVVDAGMLAELARLCGPEALVAMVRSGRLELSYLANALAVKTENTGMVNELHTPTTFSVIGHLRCKMSCPAFSKRRREGRPGPAPRQSYCRTYSGTNIQR
jgi:hypothetical protein